MAKLNRWALGWSIVWVVLLVLLTLQFALLSVPDGDLVLGAIDVLAIFFVLVRLRTAVSRIKPPAGRSGGDG